MTINLELSERMTFVVAEHGPWIVEIIPMIYNHRVVLTRKGDNTGYVHGWCYQDAHAAVLAAAAFNPLTQAEPAGYFKRATPDLREPGED